MKFSPQQKNGGIHFYLLGSFIAIELLMSFSFLGYFHIEPISITIAYIPVLLTGALLGPLDAAIVGAVFGLASMWKASAHYIMDFDQLFSPMMSGAPMKSFLLSVGSRALFGLAVGLLYFLAKKSKHPAVGIGIISFFGPALHSFFVYSALWAFFPETGYTSLDTFGSFRTLDGLLTDFAAMGLILLGWYIMQSSGWKQFQKKVESVQNSYLAERYHVVSLLCIILLALLSSVAVAIYFVNRMGSVLDQEGFHLTDEEHGDLLHLQIQFLIGILAMMALLIIFLVFNRRYSTYMDWEAKRDSLTGALNRKAFFQSCGKAIKNMETRDGATAYFIMIDMDWFKEINDRFGHPEGDRVLREVVQELEAAFGRDGFIGRLGGDEFAVFLYEPVTREELERSLQRFQERLGKIKWENRKLSCSIGAQPVRKEEPAEILYQAADKLLYMAKQQGKDQYQIGPLEKESLDKAVI